MSDEDKVMFLRPDAQIIEYDGFNVVGNNLKGGCDWLGMGNTLDEAWANAFKNLTERVRI